MGQEAVRRIMLECPTHIVICTAGTTGMDASNAYEAIKSGALAAVEKPDSPHNYEACRHVLSTIKLVAGIPLRTGAAQATPPAQAAPESSLITGWSGSYIQAIGIAASSGGPAVLQAMLSRLPADFPIPILVVQHTLVGFAEGLAEWLSQNVPQTVRLARHGEPLPMRCVLIAPGDYHLRINPLKRVELTQTLPVKGQRPSAAILFQSLANVFGSAALGVLLNHVGEDGLEALFVLRSSGGRVIVQQDDTRSAQAVPPGVQSVPAERLAAAILEQVAK
jgi:two-component system chemotaxis response regulator CheB